ncbi:trans-aconitate 2-methyltransferase [Nocardia sp. CNY236]|uniref:class I SAM-dependent methyltransferase n=1 Tax=Nocardia sp. CNY236 TaxID=1169152 RepID=UPI000408389F|nr:class I SAM-dependent methyltransferase [Nocardia sp. CNY236]
MSEAAPNPADTYSVTAEFYDFMATPYWAQVDPLLPALLAEVDTMAGPLLDIGAGTGLSTVAIADALPEAEIVAVEPSAAMRAVLMSRLAARKDLRERITVESTGFFDAQLPNSCAAVVGLGVLGHFDAAARSRLWSRIVGILVDAGTAVIEVQQPYQVVAIPARRYTRAAAGRLRYEGWSEAIPIDDRSLTWRMSYYTLRDEIRIAEHVTEHRVWPVTPDAVVAEAASVGLVAEPSTGTGLLRFTKKSNHR